ncbi:MAG: mercuric transporter MerT family protein [Propylenella sp.]
MAIGADQEDVIRRGDAGGLLAAGGLIGAVLASSCCILPLAFVMLGVSGVWIGGLTALAPYQPLFLAVAFAAIARGFWLAYRRPQAACASGACATPRRGVKAALWAASFLVIASVGVNFFAPMVM